MERRIGRCDLGSFLFSVIFLLIKRLINREKLAVSTRYIQVWMNQRFIQVIADLRSFCAKKEEQAGRKAWVKPEDPYFQPYSLSLLRKNLISF